VDEFGTGYNIIKQKMNVVHGTNTIIIVASSVHGTVSIVSDSCLVNPFEATVITTQFSL